MAVRLPNGSIFAIASSLAASKTMSAVTNADPAVATLEASHGVAQGEYILITSGWPKLDGRVVRAGSVETNDVQLAGIDTSDTARYPVGAGVGSVREISTWQTITQITDISTQGGDQQFTNYAFLDSDDEFQIPTVRSPQSIQLQIADDPTLAHYAVIKEASDTRTPTPARLTLPNGSVILYNGYWTLNETPTLTRNQIMVLGVTLSLVALPTRYAS